MPAPLIGAAAAAAARVVAKKLATQGAKKVAKTATSRARANSAAVAKKVAPKSSIAKRQEMIAAQEKLSPKEIIKTNPKFQGQMKSVLPSRALGGRSVKAVSPSALRSVKNRTSNVTSQLRKSGEAAKRSAADVKTGTPNTTVKIKSGGNVKPAVPKKTKAPSYNQAKNMPNLIKIDSAKGSKLKKTAYRYFD
jgi:hypothetical protein